MTVSIVPGDEAEAKVWATALDVARLFADIPWLLIGAQMVMLLEREAQRPSGRTTGDIDVVVDVRALPDGARAAAERLIAAGFAPASAQNPYRFVRGTEQVDLLAPDHLGAHADLKTIGPAITTEIPGASRALATSREVEVDVAGIGSGSLPIPSLGGAIVIKVRAWQARTAPRDAEDLVRLLAIVEDVEAVRRELKPAERRSLGRVGPLADQGHRGWRAVGNADDARAAFARLSD